MKKTLKWIISSLVIFFTIATIQAQETQLMIGQAAPLFRLKALDGKTYSLEQLKGKYVLVHFAATWCPFCNAEAPNLEEVFESYTHRGVEVLLVDVKEDSALVGRSFQRFHFSFPVLLDEDGTVSAKYAPVGAQPALARDEVPIASNLIIDREGKIRFYSLLNTESFDAKLTALRKKLDELLKEAN
jgi:peroxiredoxin